MTNVLNEYLLAKLNEMGVESYYQANTKEISENV